MDNNNDSPNVGGYSVSVISTRLKELSVSSDNLAKDTLPLCRNLLNEAFLSLNTPEYTKQIALLTVDTNLGLIKPYTLLKAKDHREPDGTTVLSLLEYMLSIVRTHGLQDLDVSIHESILSTDPRAPFNISCQNIIYCLEEFKELLKRADGNQDTDLETHILSPFLNTEYFCTTLRKERLGILRFFYPFQRVNDLSDSSHALLANVTQTETFGGMKDSLLLEKYIDDANTSLESHKKELSCKIDCTGKITLHDKFKSIIIYLLRFIEFTDVKNFDENEEFVEKILNNLDGFYYILKTSSLTEVLNPENENMIEYFKDIIFASNQALMQETDCSLLVKKLQQLIKVAYQLWHMCLKQMSVHPAWATEYDIFFEYPLRTLLLVDVVTEPSTKHWKLKFASLTNQDEILNECPYDECCICNAPFVDADGNTESRDIAVLSRCPHLFCVPCLVKSFVAKATSASE